MKASKIIVLLGLFLVGGFVGFFVAGRMAKHRITRMHHMAQEPGKETKRLFHILDLDQEQREQIRPILERHLPEHRRVRREFHHRMDSLRNAMFGEMEAYLSLEQKEKLEALKKHRPPGPPRPRARHRQMNPDQERL